MDLETIFQGKMNEHKWNMLGDYLKGSKVQPGSGMMLERSSSNGVLVSAIPQRQAKPTQAPPFSVLSLAPVPESDPAEYKVTMQEGWVIERHTTSGDDGVEFHEVEVNGSVMSTRARPELTMEDGDFALCYYTTDDDGYITSVPEIQADAEQDTDHHQPASGAGSGSSGYYYVKLFQLNIVDGAPEITVHQQSDIEHSRIWNGRNIGSARYIHKEWNGTNDSYDFRTLEQNEPVGRTYGKVIVDEVGAEFDAVNDSIKFSAIAQRDTDPQVKVDDDESGIVTIKGNNKDGYLLWIDCEGDDTTLMSWEDGLVTTSGEVSFTAGCCDGLPTGYAGDMLYHNGTDWVVLSAPNAALITDGTYEHYEMHHDGTAPSWSGVV